MEDVTRPFSDVEHVGMVIRKISANQLHSGFLYDQGLGPRMLHLAFHHDLRDEEAALPYRWAQIGIDEDNKLVLAKQLSRIAGAEPKISYGFNFEGVAFDPNTGDLLPAPAGRGLTCATFIVAALRAFGHDLVVSETWPDRADDEEWRQSMLELMEHRVDGSHLEAVRTCVSAGRLRPDEIVGAGANDAWPVEFLTARELADQVIADLT